MSYIVLIVAGLDPSGGAGLVADVATVTARGGRAAAVATALTLQDSSACHEVHPAPASLVARQLALLIADFSSVGAIKVGMLASADIAAAVAAGLAPLVARGVPLVLDPVLRATAGSDLLAAGDPARALAPLLRLATLVTPNRDEAARLTGLPVDDAATQRVAARALRLRHPQLAVLLKGGHLPGDPVVDLLDDGAATPLELTAPRRPGLPPHGTGCALSTEIACQLAQRHPLRPALTTAHHHLQARLATATPLGKGRAFLGTGSGVPSS